MKPYYAIIATAALLIAGSSSAQMMGPGMGSTGSQPGQGIARNTMMVGMPGYGMDFGPFTPEMLESLGLTPEQRAAIDTIRVDFWRAEWDFMGDMQALMGRPPRQDGGYDEMIALRREMLGAMDEARTRTDAVLTPEQRERLRQLSSCRP